MHRTEDKINIEPQHILQQCLVIVNQWALTDMFTFLFKR